MFSFNVLTGAIQIYHAENSIKTACSFHSRQLKVETGQNVQLLFNTLEF